MQERAHLQQWLSTAEINTALAPVTLDQVPPNLATGLSDNAALSYLLNFDGSAEAQWRPSESQAPVRRNRTLGELLGSYVNGSEHLQPSKATATAPAAVLQNDDPVLHRDESLLAQEISGAIESVFGNVFRTIADDDSGKVRFSVFGFGNFSLERTSSDPRFVLNIHNEQLLAAGEIQDVDGDPLGAAPAGETLARWYGFVRNNVLSLAVLALVTMVIARVVRRRFNKAVRSAPTQQNSEQRGNETAVSASQKSDRAESSKRQRSRSGRRRLRRHASFW